MLLLLVVVVGLAAAQTPAPTIGGFCLPALSCDGGFCNTAPTKSCTSNDTATLEAECPCQCTEQCVDPADLGEFCQIRDCWAGQCVIMNISEFVCDTYEACTTAECFSNTTTNTSDCTDAVRTEGCCQMADPDCTPPLFNDPMPACTRFDCLGYSAMLGHGVCTLVNESGNCCADDSDCALVNLCFTSVCENMTDANMNNESTGVCSTPVETLCVDPDPSDLCYVGRCNASDGMCDNVILNVDECPGACCINTTEIGCMDVIDKAWCDYEGGSFFMGINCSETVCVTAEPTPAPTTEPTAEPTLEPTKEPSAEPTREPTPHPTTEPTREPSAEPTLEPTGEPTREPTGEPTLEPTGEPTLEPTGEPTLEPTAEPPRAPTREPTPAPTGEPSAEPTAEPTHEPTAEPTLQPTPEPTAQCSSPTQCPTNASKCYIAECFNESSSCGFVA